MGGVELVDSRHAGGRPRLDPRRRPRDAPHRSARQGSPRRAATSSRSAASSAQPVAARRLSNSTARRGRHANSSCAHHPGTGPFGELGVVGGMAAAQPVEVPAGRLGPGRNGATSPAAGSGSVSPERSTPDHRLGHQAGQRVDHIPALDPLPAAHGHRGGLVEAGREHPEAVEHRPFGVVEQRSRTTRSRPAASDGAPPGPAGRRSAAGTAHRDARRSPPGSSSPPGPRPTRWPTGSHPDGGKPPPPPGPSLRRARSRGRRH